MLILHSQGKLTVSHALWTSEFISPAKIKTEWINLQHSVMNRNLIQASGFLLCTFISSSLTSLSVSLIKTRYIRFLLRLGVYLQRWLQYVTWVIVVEDFTSCFHEFLFLYGVTIRTESNIYKGVRAIKYLSK